MFGWLWSQLKMSAWHPASLLEQGFFKYAGRTIVGNYIIYLSTSVSNTFSVFNTSHCSQNRSVQVGPISQGQEPDINPSHGLFFFRLSPVICGNTFRNISGANFLVQSGNLWGEKLEFTVFEKLDNDKHLLVYQKGSKCKGIVMASPSKAW